MNLLLWASVGGLLYVVLDYLMHREWSWGEAVGIVIEGFLIGLIAMIVINLAATTHYSMGRMTQIFPLIDNTYALHGFSGSDAKYWFVTKDGMISRDASSIIVVEDDNREPVLEHYGARFNTEWIQKFLSPVGPWRRGTLRLVVPVGGVLVSPAPMMGGESGWMSPLIEYYYM